MVVAAVDHHHHHHYRYAHYHPDNQHLWTLIVFATDRDAFE